MKCPECDLEMEELEGRFGIFFSCNDGCKKTMSAPKGYIKNKPSIKMNDMVVDYYKVDRFSKWKPSGRSIKSGTKTNHWVSFEGDEEIYKISAIGWRQHMYIGDKCNFEYKEIAGDKVILGRSVKLWKKNGEEIKQRGRHLDPKNQRHYA